MGRGDKPIVLTTGVSSDVAAAFRRAVPRRTKFPVATPMLVARRLHDWSARHKQDAELLAIIGGLLEGWSKANTIEPSLRKN